MADEKTKGPLAPDGTSTGVSRPAFTVDHQESQNLIEVPSITKLLNRKTLEAKANNPPPAKVSPMKEAAPPSPPPSRPEVRAVSAPRDRRSTNRIDLWDLGRMKQSQHAQEKLAHELFDKRILHSCLYFTPVPRGPGEMTPQFTVQAASGERISLATWTGIRWVTSQTPLIWNSLVRNRCFSLTGTSQGALQQEEQVWRAALGAPQQMIVTIVRIGPSNQAQGILVCISQQAVTENKVEEILSTVQAGRAA